jgi:hypothetical protein
MSSLVIEIQEARAQRVEVSEDTLTIELVDDGTLIHWLDLDEDLSVAGILAGRRSGESSQSLKKWLAERGA